MNLSKVVNTTGLLCIGAYDTLHSVKLGINTVKESSLLTVLKISSILFPLFILIEKGTEKVLDDLGWKSGFWRDLTVYSFTYISSIAIASTACVGFGFTNSVKTGFKVAEIASFLFLGIMSLNNGLENLVVGTNNLCRFEHVVLRLIHPGSPAIGKSYFDPLSLY